MDPPTIRHRRWMALAAVLLALLVFDLSIDWMTFRGASQSLVSPDRRFQAQLQRTTRGSLLRGKSDTCELRILTEADRKELWSLQFESPPDAAPTRADAITWAADSSSVTFPINNGATVTVPTR